MAKFRRAAKVDKNQTDIVASLRTIPGMTVEVGHDDILVGYMGRTYWYEIKSPDCVKADGTLKAGALKDSQIALKKTWRGHYRIVWSLPQIISDINNN